MSLRELHLYDGTNVNGVTNVSFTIEDGVITVDSREDVDVTIQLELTADVIRQIVDSAGESASK